MDFGFEGGNMRIFLAINFGKEALKQLVVLRDKLQDSSKGGNFTLNENLHLTLAFIGECNEEQVASVKAAMDSTNFEPFDLTIGHIGRFKRADGDILWVGIGESKPLMSLQRNLTEKLIAMGFALDKRPYSPHITLGRKVVTNVIPQNFSSFKDTISAIDLMKSERINGKLTYTAIHTKGVIL